MLCVMQESKNVEKQSLCNLTIIQNSHLNLKFWELKNVKLSIPHLKYSSIFVKYTLTQQGFDLLNDMIYSMDWKSEAASHEALNVFSQVRFCAGAGAALW